MKERDLPIPARVSRSTLALATFILALLEVGCRSTPREVRRNVTYSPAELLELLEEREFFENSTCEELAQVDDPAALLGFLRFGACTSAIRSKVEDLIARMDVNDPAAASRLASIAAASMVARHSAGEVDYWGRPRDGQSLGYDKIARAAVLKLSTVPDWHRIPEFDQPDLWRASLTARGAQPEEAELLFTAWALHSAEASRRSAALAELGTAGVLEKIALSDRTEAEQLEAVRALDDPNALAKIAAQSKEKSVTSAAIDKIKDDDSLLELAQTSSDPEIQLSCNRAISDEVDDGDLLDAFESSTSFKIRRELVRRIDDRHGLILLGQTALQGNEPQELSIAQEALRRLAENHADTTPKQRSLDAEYRAKRRLILAASEHPIDRLIAEHGDQDVRALTALASRDPPFGASKVDSSEALVYLIQTILPGALTIANFDCSGDIVAKYVDLSSSPAVKSARREHVATFSPERLLAVREAHLKLCLSQTVLPELLGSFSVRLKWVAKVHPPDEWRRPVPPSLKVEILSESELPISETTIPLPKSAKRSLADASLPRRIEGYDGAKIVEAVIKSVADEQQRIEELEKQVASAAALTASLTGTAAGAELSARLQGIALRPWTRFARLRDRAAEEKIRSLLAGDRKDSEEGQALRRQLVQNHVRELLRAKARGTDLVDLDWEVIESMASDYRVPRAVTIRAAPSIGDRKQLAEEPVSPTEVLDPKPLVLKKSKGRPLSAEKLVELEWDPVTTNADGTPIEDLAGYRVEYRQVGGPAKGSVLAGLKTRVELPALVPGTYRCEVRAFDESGNISEPSNTLEVVIER